jgi:hypothetical protein
MSNFFVPMPEEDLTKVQNIKPKEKTLAQYEDDYRDNYPFRSSPPKINAKPFKKPVLLHYDDSSLGDAITLAITPSEKILPFQIGIFVVLFLIFAFATDIGTFGSVALALILDVVILVLAVNYTAFKKYVS